MRFTRWLYLHRIYIPFLISVKSWSVNTANCCCMIKRFSGVYVKKNYQNSQLSIKVNISMLHIPEHGEEE